MIASPSAWVANAFTGVWNSRDERRSGVRAVGEPPAPTATAGSLSAQWKNVWSICVIPTRVIVEPSGSVIVVLPSATVAVATT
jgi:hypothetical protein